MTLRRRHLLPVLGSLALPALPARAESRAIVFPRAEQGGDRRDDYSVQLLLLALSKSAPGAYTFEQHKVFMLQERGLHELETSPSLDVLWTMTTAEREKNLMPILSLIHI